MESTDGGSRTPRIRALLEGTEPAAGHVEQILADVRPVMSWNNLGEVFSIAGATRATGKAHHATLLTGDPELLLDSAPWQWEDLRTPTNRQRPRSRLNRAAESGGSNSSAGFEGNEEIADPPSNLLA